MRKFLIIAAIAVLFLPVRVSAYDFNDEYRQVTNNQTIINALNSLKNTEAKWVINTVKGDNISKQPIKIMFRKLGKMNPAYKTHEALTCLDASDKIYIFINSKHKNAPVEAIATLLTHEALHQDGENSIAEETKAWTNEAVNWIAFTKRNPSLVNSTAPLVKRLNKLAKIYRTSGVNGIHKKVMSIPAYKNLEMASAGYDY